MKGFKLAEDGKIETKDVTVKVSSLKDKRRKLALHFFEIEIITETETHIQRTRRLLAAGLKNYFLSNEPFRARILAESP